MVVLVANLGSTSFKYKLFDMADDGSSEQLRAQGSADRIGQGRSAWVVEAGQSSDEGTMDLVDHAAAIEWHLEKLVELGAVTSIEQVQAIGFKAVHGGPIKGAAKVDENLLSIMEEFSDVAPQHNPPYLAAMRAFRDRLPQVHQVAAFETSFHQEIPLARQVYGIPIDWVEEHGLRRYGFHSASHRYIANRMTQLAPQAKKIISCHLGGSCSISAIRDGKSQANSFGMTVQSGVFHASRVGDFDVFALRKLLKAGLDLDTIWHRLGHEGGLKGLSGVSADMREVEKAAADGNEHAKLAIDAFVESCRHYIGAYLTILNGTDALVFTGGVGQHGAAIRAAICANLDFAGIHIDEQKNRAAKGNEETYIGPPGAISGGDPTSGGVWVLPTNEELIVARQTMEVLARQAT